jgi:hypothetical protein
MAFFETEVTDSLSNSSRLRSARDFFSVSSAAQAVTDRKPESTTHAIPEQAGNENSRFGVQIRHQSGEPNARNDSGKAAARP